MTSLSLQEVFDGINKGTILTESEYVEKKNKEQVNDANFLEFINVNDNFNYIKIKNITI
ncbi:MAG: hypothetical protein PHF25_05035 [Candidatus Margulisbacteria bacterium]|nr:hypothetical protein [Candidatus Margulisiibacteriota bacterium]